MVSDRPEQLVNSRQNCLVAFASLRTRIIASSEGNACLKYALPPLPRTYFPPPALPHGVMVAQQILNCDFDTFMTFPGVSLLIRFTS